jgi:hypothetical protein
MTQAATQTAQRKPLDFFGVKIPCIAGYWAEAWALLEPAAARNGLYTRQSVFDDLMKGNLQLWVAESDVMTIAVVTEVADYPAGRHCFIVLMGGQELDRHLQFLDVLERWAKECGCVRIVASGRPGLARKLKGYRAGSVVLTKDFYNA